MKNKTRFNFKDLQDDLTDILNAFVFTVILVGFVLAFIFNRFPGWPGFAEFSLYYVLINLVLMARFIFSRARNARTLDEIGEQVEQMNATVNDKLDGISRNV